MPGRAPYVMGLCIISALAPGSAQSWETLARWGAEESALWPAPAEKLERQLWVAGPVDESCTWDLSELVCKC